ncbi:MAG: NADH-quinone oxidoreductase subunit L [Bacteroidetes bacterium]|nr:NADH-quinone oxidoreductase subunit L [Bacteroidota bacterium]
MATESLILLVLLFPLLGGIINGIVGKNLSESLIGIIGTAMVAIPFIISFSIFLSLDKAIQIPLFTLIQMSKFSLNAGLQVDGLAIWMTMIITGIGTLIHIFSMGYMKGDSGFHKFFAYLNLFVFSMLILVLGSSFFMLFFGWEGVGICSYLLIGFHYNDKEKGMLNTLAARKAFVMNRIGDLGLLIACFLLIGKFGSLEFTEIAIKMKTIPIGMDSLAIISITLCLFLAATGKSAQIPLFTWLPDAMAGPTPVSALIHAATMVTAGIYLVVRSNFLFELAPYTQHIILYIGLATSLVAAFIAMRQNDIKKVLAYSTVSQLGLMFVALGLGSYSVAIFHVTTHAFFKALLFLGSGSIILANHHEQNITKMGGLKKYMPTTHMVFLIGTLAIAGFPFLSGFFSKDEILAAGFGHGPIIFGLLILSASLTAIYMFRMYFLVFFGEFRGDNHTRDHLHESPAVMTIPLIVLAILSIFGGALNFPSFMIESGSHWLDDFLSHSTFGLSAVHPHHLDTTIAVGIMIGTSLLTLTIIGISYIIYVTKKKTTKEESEFIGWEKLSTKKLYFDELYHSLFVKPIEWKSLNVLPFIENGILYKIISILTAFVVSSGNQIRKIQSGILSSYYFWMIIGIVGLIGYYLIYFKFWNS